MKKISCLAGFGLNKNLRGFFCLLLLMYSLELRAQQDNNINNLFREYFELLSKDITLADSLSQDLQTIIETSKVRQDSLLAKVYFLRGTVNYYKGRLFIAQKYFEDAIEKTYSWEGEKIREGCYNNLGVLFFKSSQWTECYDAYIQSLRLAEKSLDSFSIVQTWINISLLENQRLNTDLALKIGQSVLEYSIRHRDSLNIALSHQNLAIFNSDSGNNEMAYQHSEAGIEMCKLLGKDYEKCTMQLNMVYLFIEDGRYYEADSQADAVLPLLLLKGFDDLLLQYYVNKAMININRGNSFGLAREYLQKGEELSIKTGKEDVLIDIYEYYLKLAMKSHDQLLFDTSLVKFSDRKGKMFRFDADAAYEQMVVLYELDKSQKKQILLELGVGLSRQRLVLSLVFLLITLIGLFILQLQYRRLKTAHRILFKMYEKENNESKKSVRASIVNGNIATSREESSSPGAERFRKMMELLEDKKLYLDPELSIQTLSNKLLTNQKYLSQAIRENTDTNFLGLINEMRVREARRLILDITYDQRLYEIGTMSGFSNRVSFYRHFKLVTGLSPSEFKKLVNQSQKGLLTNGEYTNSDD